MDNTGDPMGNMTPHQKALRSALPRKETLRQALLLLMAAVVLMLVFGKSVGTIYLVGSFLLFFIITVAQYWRLRRRYETEGKSGN